MSRNRRRMISLDVFSSALCNPMSRSRRVVLTASDSTDLESRGVDGVGIDAAHILEKPFSLDVLATLVTDSLGRPHGAES